MNIQSPGRTGAQSGRPQSRASGSMGAVGNLQFNTEQGGTARGSGPGGLSRPDGSSISLGFLASPASVQAQRGVPEQAGDGSRRAGGLPPGSGAAPRQSTWDPQEHRAAIRQLRLHGPWEQEILARVQPGLWQIRVKLAQAVHAQDRLAASRALYDLHTLVNKAQQIYGQLPEEMVGDVRELVRGSLGLFRDAENNPQGRLNLASLERLDDFTFVYLRRASSLHSLGLELDFHAASEVAHSRVGMLSRNVTLYVKNIFLSLDVQTACMTTLIRELRHLSGLELQRVQQLADLGEFAGGGPSPGERRDLAYRICELGMRQVSGAPYHVPIERHMLRHMDLLLYLEGMFGTVHSSLENARDQEDYGEGGTEIKKQLVTTRHLLAGMIHEIDKRLTVLTSAAGSAGASIGPYADPMMRRNPRPASEAQSTLFHQALREQYRAAYDRGTKEFFPSEVDWVRARMASRLRMLPLAGSGSAQTLLLRMNGAVRAFIVDRAFYDDAIGCGNILLSVRGTGENGQAIRFTWPADLQAEDRRSTMRHALKALTQVAGPAVERLTRLMTFAGTLRVARDGLLHMGEGYPFRQDDGTYIDPGTQGALAFDVVRNEDGSFRLETTLRTYATDRVRGVQSDGLRVVLGIPPGRSIWTEVRFTLHVSSDVQRLDVVGLPQFRHSF